MTDLTFFDTQDHDDSAARDNKSAKGKNRMKSQKSGSHDGLKIQLNEVE